jgi:hypothetical protein
MPGECLGSRPRCAPTDEETDLQARASALDNMLASSTLGRAATLSDEQLQAQLDQISMRTEVNEELALLRERLASGACRSTSPFGIPLTCAWRHGRRHGKRAWLSRLFDQPGL